jgi:hypothetical protein
MRNPLSGCGLSVASNSEEQEYVVVGVDDADQPRVAFIALNKIAFATIVIDGGMRNSRYRHPRSAFRTVGLGCAFSFLLLVFDRQGRPPNRLSGRIAPIQNHCLRVLCLGTEPVTFSTKLLFSMAHDRSLDVEVLIV